MSSNVYLIHILLILDILNSSAVCSRGLNMNMACSYTIGAYTLEVKMDPPIMDSGF